MMSSITQLLFTVLVQLHQVTGNLGFAILVFTFLVRSLLFPLSLPAITSQKKIKQLQPELKKLKEKHGKNKQAFQVAQLDLYKKYNVNPLSGLVPQIIQIVLMIILYQVLVKFLHTPQVGDVVINTHFYWLDLTKPDSLKILPILAGVTQLFMSIMILPGGEQPDLVPNSQKNPQIIEKNTKEEDTAEMAATMQKQMLFMMPLTMIFIAWTFPSGLSLYMVATTVFSIIQQWIISGPGGITLYASRILSYIRR